jgi:predicted NBD/HSP70 family sugar kinase
MADIVLRVEDLEKWRDGNGKPGAAAVIAEHEKRLNKVESRCEDHGDGLALLTTQLAVARAMEKTLVVEAVAEAMKTRSRSMEGVIRAWGPYFAALCALAAAIVPQLAPR